LFLRINYLFNQAIIKIVVYGNDWIKTKQKKYYVRLHIFKKKLYNIVGKELNKNEKQIGLRKCLLT
jgi:hypothetical protein